ncbi:alpha/beta hydrolase domain-containing protein [Planctellipticum variicoloris]|uniref:alpha/beta hydrolase domain-containing protein n=1 Tax=Planctellipticum variicoloris TaxID=3064265 RepID=UPI003013376A|nr:hypothetical protein SH412_002410 [Planctomycetaceae bacterium SH412]
MNSPAVRGPVTILALAAGLLLPLTAAGEVVRFEILERAPLAGGKAYGATGAYERITGRVYYAVDPALPQNRQVIDLPLAPRNGAGKVEFSADFCILAPADSARGNGCALYDVNNRGNKLALGMFNYGGGNALDAEKDLGDGFLFRHGFTVVWSGWDGELLPAEHRLRLAAPAAVSPAGPITGLVRCEVCPTSPVTRMAVNWANHGSYRPTAGGIAKATLTVRERPDDSRHVVSRDQWELHVTELPDQPVGQLPKVELEVPAGMKPGFLYEVIYEAQDPVVMGAGFLGVRDLISALKHGTGADHPLLRDGKPVIRDAIGFGVSQSGRFLREYLYSGFNEDERGRKVFEGLIPHVAGGGLGSFNHRFAQPTRHGSQHDHADYPVDRFPFAYEVQRDPFSGAEDGLLRRAEASGTAPLIMHTQSAAEYWTRAGSLPHTTADGKADAHPPANVRFYTFGGTQHGPSKWPPEAGSGKNLANPGDYKPFLRSLLLTMLTWMREGIEPPPSRIPSIADGTLAGWSTKETKFPALSGVIYPLVIRQPPWLDLGPRWSDERIIDHQPPRIIGHYSVLVPKCGPDGNELGCLLPVEVAAPVATYTGWNVRSRSAGAEDQLVSLTGSYIPFSLNRVERQATGDLRVSLEERYGTLERYMQQFDQAIETLQEAGFLLAEDAKRLPGLHRERVAPLFEKLPRP